MRVSKGLTLEKEEDRCVQASSGTGRFRAAGRAAGEDVVAEN